MSTFEAKKDFTLELQAIIPESVSIAKVKSIDEAINVLLALEKKCRVNNDTTNLKEVCIHMIRICKENNHWMKLNGVIAIINKRSSLIKTVIVSVVAEALLYVNDAPSLEEKIELIKSLKDLCDGKIYVEGESACLHFMLSKIYEDKGDIDAACDIIQDVHVETYGSLSKKEKAEYILEQMRLNLLRKDYIRTLIHSRKMNTKTIEEDGLGEVKIKFYTMMIEYYTIEKNAWEICQAYYKIALTKISISIQDEMISSASNETMQLEALESCIIFLIISKHDNHQNDMMHRIKEQIKNQFKDLSLPQIYSNVLRLFTTYEVIHAPFSGQNIFESHLALRKLSGHNEDITSYFIMQLNDRIVQHNIRVIARYYKKIRIQRLCVLLNLHVATLEKCLSEMSSLGDVYLKIDRPAGIVSFQEKQHPEEVLTEWSNDITKMLQLMESTCHLVNRENMVYKV